MLWWTFQNLVTAGLMAGVVWLLCRLGRVGPVGRHALWLIVLLKLLTPPLIVWPWAVRDPLSRLTRLPTEPLPAAIATESNVPRSMPPMIVAVTPPPVLDDGNPEFIETPASIPVCAATLSPPANQLPAKPVIAAAPAGAWLTILLQWAGRLWLAGGILFGLVHLARIARLVRMRWHSQAADATLLQRIQDISERLGLPPVKTRVVAGISSPLVWCLVHPEMLWPAVLPEMAELSIRGLIVHELAHLKRRDHWVGWLELAAGCFWWWNPLYWYVRHQLRDNAELACDAWVVQTLPGGRRAYAEALLSVCESMAVSRHISRPATLLPALGVGSGGRQILERRLAMILREHFPLHIPRIGWLMIGLMMAGTLPAWSQRAADEPESASREARLIRRAVAVGAAVQIPLPGNAQELIRKFEQQEARGQAEMAKRQSEQRELLIKQLRELQDRYTKAGQLNEAVAIRDQIRQMSEAGVAVPGVVGPIPDPANATQFRGQVNRPILIVVTGGTEGTVWGNEIYTDDSAIATAAVHAGVLQPGERGVVRLTLLPGRDHYEAATNNGVTTLPYGPWPGSYRIDGPIRPLNSYRGSRSPANTPPLDEQGSVTTLRDKVGSTFMFKVIGSTTGSIWGTGIYSDDSPIAVAAVHAGLVLPGEPTWVRVTVLPGQDRYEASTKNGVTSLEFGPFEGSYRIERAPAMPTEPPRTYGPSGRNRLDEPAHDAGPAESSLESLRDGAFGAAKADHPPVLERLVTGSTTGSVWGTDVYTDDSSIAAAAVHAGVLRDGEQGWVRITLLPDCGNYTGTTRNGVTSQNWGSWGGSFRIERGSPPADEPTLRLLVPGSGRAVVIPPERTTREK